MLAEEEMSTALLPWPPSAVVGVLRVVAAAAAVEGGVAHMRSNDARKVESRACATTPLERIFRMSASPSTTALCRGPAMCATDKAARAGGAGRVHRRGAGWCGGVCRRPPGTPLLSAAACATTCAVGAAAAPAMVDGGMGGGGSWAPAEAGTARVDCGARGGWAAGEARGAWTGVSGASGASGAGVGSGAAIGSPANDGGWFWRAARAWAASRRRKLGASMPCPAVTSSCMPPSSGIGERLLAGAGTLQ